MLKKANRHSENVCVSLTHFRKYQAISHLGDEEPKYNVMNYGFSPPADISRLTPIKDQVPDYIEFNHIKIVIAILQRRYGMNLDNEETSPTATTSGGTQGGMGKVNRGSQGGTPW